MIFGPFDPSGKRDPSGDPSGNEGSPPMRERGDPSSGGTLPQRARSRVGKDYVAHARTSRSPELPSVVSGKVSRQVSVSHRM